MSREAQAVIKEMRALADIMCRECDHPAYLRGWADRLERLADVFVSPRPEKDEKDQEATRVDEQTVIPPERATAASHHTAQTGTEQAATFTIRHDPSEAQRISDRLLERMRILNITDPADPDYQKRTKQLLEQVDIYQPSVLRGDPWVPILLVSFAELETLCGAASAEVVSQPPQEAFRAFAERLRMRWEAEKLAGPHRNGTESQDAFQRAIDNELRDMQPPKFQASAEGSIPSPERSRPRE